MNQETKEIGKLFRKKRQEMGLTLKEIENSTSIRSEFLHAIEEGTIAHYLAGIYAVGFIKQYASTLGLDVEQMMRNFPLAFQMKRQIFEFEYGIGTLEMRSRLNGGIKSYSTFLWIGGGALLLIVIYYVGKGVGIV